MYENQKKSHVEDGNFEFSAELNDNTLRSIENLGVNIEKNYYVNANDFKGEKGESILRIYKNRNKVNTASIFEGKLPEEQSEIALDRLFAENNKIKVGDIIQINNINLKVCGTISLPDYNSLFKNNLDIVMETVTFGIATINETDFDTISNTYGINYKYSYYFKNENLTETEKEKLYEDIKECLIKEVTKQNIENPLNNIEIVDFLTRENNQSITFLEEDIGKDVPAMKSFLIIIIVMMAFVFVVLTNNTIDHEANIIGTLRASGYTKSEIIRHYLKISAFITIASAIIGNLIGYFLLIEPFKKIYYTTYCVSPFIMRWNLEAFILTTIIPIALMILINYFMLKNKLSLSPLKFLRGDLKKNKNKKAVKLPSKMSFKNRFRLRVIIQNKSSFLILFIGIFLGSLILMFGIGFMPLLNHHVDTVSETIPVNYQYVLKAPIESNDGEKVTLQNFQTYYEFGNRDMEINFYGITEDSQYYKNINLPEDESSIVISDNLAKKMKLNVGDIVEFKNKYLKETYKLKISDIYSYKVSFAAFMKQENLNKLLDKDEGYFNIYVSNDKLDLDNNYVAKVITKDDMKNVITQMLSSFEGMIEIVIAFAICIYLVLMYVLTKVVIDKNANNISLMKVFGYTEKEIRKFYLKSTTYTILLSLITVIPLNIATFKLILEYALAEIEGYFEFYLPVYIYLEMVLMGILSYFAINGFHILKVKKIKMNEVLKNRE